jgi:hypothetical protein
MPTPTKPVTRAPKESLISPEADRELLRIVVVFGGTFFVLALLLNAGMAWVNLPHTPLYGMRRFLDTISVLVFMTPFFLGINIMNKARLKYARKYVQEENWKAVYYSVEFFTHLGQKWLDSTGEAHYLLAIALDHQGQREAARKARLFITKHRPSGEWAAKLRAVEASRAPRKISEIKAEKGEAGRKLNKARRRF